MRDHMGYSEPYTDHAPCFHFRQTSGQSFIVPPSTSFPSDPVSAWSGQEKSRTNYHSHLKPTHVADGFFPHSSQMPHGLSEHPGFHLHSTSHPWTNQSTGSVASPLEHGLGSPRNENHLSHCCIDPNCLLLRRPQESSTASYPPDHNGSTILPNPGVGGSMINEPVPFTAPSDRSRLALGQPRESDIRSSLEGLQERQTLFYQDTSNSATDQFQIRYETEGHGNADDGRENASTLLEDCSSDCFEPCNQASDECNKPYKCTTPVGECLEVCEDAVDQCGKGNRCESEQCEEQQGFCIGSDIGQGPTSAPSHSQGCIQYMQSYSIAVQGQTPFLRHQAPWNRSSTSSTPALSYMGAESVDNVDSPEPLQGFSDVRVNPGNGPLKQSYIPTSAFESFGQIEGEYNKQKQQLHDTPSVLTPSSFQSPGDNIDLKIDFVGSTQENGGEDDFSDGAFADIAPTHNLGQLSSSLSPAPHDDQPKECLWQTEDKTCSQWFTESSLQSHWNDEHGQDGNHCKWSGCKTATKELKRDKLKRHMLQHTGLKEFLCAFCLMAFNNKSNLKQHVDSKHKEKPRKVRCALCGKELASRSTLDEHMRAIHSNAKDFKCRYCPHVANNDRNVNKHMRSTFTLSPQCARTT